jgi:TolA-binding protein
LGLVFTPGAARADAAGDLEKGRAALEAGEFDKALPLLTSAAQDLPQSVEAQFALAECFLKLGQTDKALDRYQKVLALSPTHAAAKRIVDGLTGRRQDFSERMELAKTFLKIGALKQAETVLQRVVAEPVTDAQREEARLLLIQSRLWANNIGGAFDEAVRLMQTKEHADTGRVLAVLALLGAPQPDLPAARALLDEVKLPEGDPPVWRGWYNAAALLLKLEESAPTSEATRTLSQELAAVPPSPFRAAVMGRVFNKVAAQATELTGKGNVEAALRLLWPMVSNAEVSGADVVLKPVPVQGGWLDRTASAAPLWVQVARALAAIGRAGSNRHGAEAQLLGYWLAAEVTRQAPPAMNRPDQLVQVARELAAHSRPAPGRQPGGALSQADKLQLAVLQHAAALAVFDSERMAIADLAIAQITRYQQAEDIETGISLVISIDAAADVKAGERLPLIGSLNALPNGEARGKLLRYLADRVVELGAAAFQEAAATTASDANRRLNRFDAAAMNLYGELAAINPETGNFVAAVDAVIQRYSNVEAWEAASDAATRFYTHLSGDAGRWAAIRLKLSQAQRVEDKSLAANRQLGKELPALVKEALAETLKIVQGNASKAHRRAAIQIAEPLVNRYVDLERYDLADAVIAVMGNGEEAAPLADWAAWMRIQLLDRQANRALALATNHLDPRSQPALVEFHKTELEQIALFIAKFPKSEYLGHAVERVVQIATTYQNHRAFAVANEILTKFLAAHPKLEFAERIDYQIAQLAVVKARHAFEQRKEKTQLPAALSDEFAAAIEALTKFLKSHPTGQFAQAAENELLAIARTYGEAGAWPIARDVIERFAAAVPDLRSPAHLQLLRAATYLGELDRNYGLSLLTPTPVPADRASTPGGDPVAKSGGGGSVDGRLDGHFEGDAARMPAGAGAPFGGGIPGASKPDAGYALNGPMEASADDSKSRSQPSMSDLALAQVRRAQRENLTTIAMLERSDAQAPAKQTGQDIALPTGSVLSAAEMKRQDEASDKAYAILIELAKTTNPAGAHHAEQARGHIHWMFGFFESQLRADRAVALIKRYLSNRPTEPARVSLAFRVLNNLLAWAAQRQPTDRVNKQWIDERHQRFEQARGEIEAFIKEFADRSDWVQQAQILQIDSYDRESQLAGLVSPVRAAGLLLQAAEAITALFQTAPDHPATPHLAERLWNLSERLVALGQQEQAIYVLSQIPMYFPTDALATQAVLRTAELYAQDLSNPLRAIETYQEYLGLAGDNEAIRSQIFSIAQQLVSKQRYLEALHVFGAFVDSFPTDPRAAQALLQIGQTHQANEAWSEAMQAYDRILAEYPGVPITPQVKLAVAECHINLSQWRQARKLYEEYVQQFPSDGQAELARQRIEVLKNLDRYQILLADDQVQRNKDDAQFQIGVIVLEKLGNPLKAVAEFRKVVGSYAKSPQADDAQLEIGKALLALNRLEEAREELLKVPQDFPGSPLADDALYLIGQSYERTAQQLAVVTGEKAREEAFERGQRGAYVQFNEQLQLQAKDFAARRDMLKREGKKEEIALDEAAQAFRLGAANLDTLGATARGYGIQAETESALQVANRQDRVNEAYRQAVAVYSKAATEYPLGDMTDEALLRMAQIYDTELKDRVAAMATYQKVVKFFPGTPVAEDAAWKVAQFNEQEGKYKEAVDAYREFIRNYPASGRVADAQFAMAEALEQLGRWVEAMDAYETFRQKFTTHPKVQLALDQINWIKAYRK